MGKSVTTPNRSTNTVVQRGLFKFGHNKCMNDGVQATLLLLTLGDMMKGLLQHRSSYFHTNHDGNGNSGTNNVSRIESPNEIHQISVYCLYPIHQRVEYWRQLLLCDDNQPICELACNVNIVANKPPSATFRQKCLGLGARNLGLETSRQFIHLNGDAN